MGKYYKGARFVFWYLGSAVLVAYLAAHILYPM